MDSATISALAALSGAAIGGVTSFGTSWLSQQTQAKVQARAHKLSQREELYKHFIEKASKAYADSLVRQAANVGGNHAVGRLVRPGQHDAGDFVDSDC